MTRVGCRIVRAVTRRGALVAMTCLLAGLPSARADDAVRLSTARTDENGFLVHDVESPYQSGKTQIHVLHGGWLKPGRRYPVVYVLPVESGNEHRYGHGLLEVKNHDLHEKHEVIFVAPTFSHTPWFADHPSDRGIRQETYFVKVVLPLVEQTYPAQTEPRGRLLLGFSKSGWGAWTLLLRNPEVFGRAAAWDSPMLMDRFGEYGSGAIFGDEENFRRYQVTRLLPAKAHHVRDSKRLILMARGPKPQGHEKVHALLEELKIPHEYRDGPERTHDWHSGWVSEAVELLLADDK
jgi:S-formylglutathione hydrolase FrmB